MDYHLQVSDKEFGVIWAGLGELPSKHTFALMGKLKAQVEQQEGAMNGPQTRSGESGPSSDATDRGDPVG